MRRRITYSILAFMLSIQLFGQTTTIKVGTSTRTMYVYAPSGIEKDKPLLISLHGMGQDINYQKNQAQWELVADTARFVVVYPAGNNNSWDLSGTSDLNFITTIIDEMYSKYAIDKKRVYLSGFSMGGMMTYYAMNHIADKIAAFAPVSGYPVSGAVFTSSRPIPIIHTNGDADDVVHYEPWSGTFNGMYQNQIGAEAMATNWAKSNGCEDTPEITMVNNCATRRLWKNGDCGVEVCLNKIPGKGHWHSNDETCYHTSREIWKFIRRYTLDCGSSNSITLKRSDDENLFAPAEINLTTEINVTGSQIIKVEFFNGTEKIGESTNAPYECSWTKVEEGSYTLTAVATDNTGKQITSSELNIVVNLPQAPYLGIAAHIPGTIEAENYDVGGEGFAYHDSDVENKGGVYRNDGVDITGSDEIGHMIGWTIKGEWLEYTVNVENTNTYDWEARVSAGGDGSAFHILLDDKDITGNIEVPNTGDWETYTTVKGKTPEMEEGEHILKLVIDGDYFNMDWIKFKDETVEVETVISDNSAKAAKYLLCNLLGKRIKEIRISENENIHECLNQMGLSKGVYLLKSEGKGESFLVTIK